MKRLFFFLTVASTATFVSCGSDDSDGTAVPVASSIILASNVTTIDVGQSVTFTVTDDLANVVTESSEFFANDVAIEGATWTPTAAGTFTIHATHTNGDDEVLISNDVVVVVSQNYINYNNAITETTAGDMYFWGVYYTDASQTSLVSLWSVIAHDGDLGTGGVAPGNIAFVDFWMPYTEGQDLELPTAGIYTWAAPFPPAAFVELTLDGTAVEITDFNAVSVNLTELTSLGAGDAEISFKTTTTVNGTSTLNTAFTGNGKIYDASARPAANSIKKVEVLNRAKLNAKKANLLKR